MRKLRWILYIVIIIMLLTNCYGCSTTNRRHNLMHYRQMRADFEEIHKTIDSWVFDLDY
ncbi:MAG: hypothetical protein ACK4NF_04475 [Planctomycetota bacterium]